MKTFFHKYGMLIAVLTTILIVTGCQSATKTPTEKVIVERETSCPNAVQDFKEQGGIKVKDAELGDVDRGFVIWFTFSCQEPYAKGKQMAIQDGWYQEDGKYHWTSLQEVITDEGGIWKGTCDNIQDKTSICQFTGESKYEGLKSYSEYDFQTATFKIRVTSLMEGK